MPLNPHHCIDEPLLCGNLDYLVRLLDCPTETHRLELPHVPHEKSNFWTVLRDMVLEYQPDEWYEERIPKLAAEIKAAAEEEVSEDLHGLPRSLVKKHGELAVAVIQRVWDLHIAMTTDTKTPGYEKTALAKDEFTIALKDAVLRLFYITLFQSQLRFSLSHWECDCRNYEKHRGSNSFVTAVLWWAHDDLKRRLKGECFITSTLRDTLARKPLDDELRMYMIGDANEVQHIISETASKFCRAPHEVHDCTLHGERERILSGVAIRMVMGWWKFSMGRTPTVEEVVTILSRDMEKSLEGRRDESDGAKAYCEGDPVIAEHTSDRQERVLENPSESSSGRCSGVEHWIG